MKALVSGPAGALSDHFGRLLIVSIGWVARVLLLIAFAVLPDGMVWQWLGMSSAFGMAAFLTTLSIMALRLMASRKPQG